MCVCMYVTVTVCMYVYVYTVVYKHSDMYVAIILFLSTYVHMIYLMTAQLVSYFILMMYLS